MPLIVCGTKLPWCCWPRLKLWICAAALGAGTRKIYETVRLVAAFQDQDRAMEHEIDFVGQAFNLPVFS